MTGLLSGRFWEAAAERCVKTFAQTLLAQISIGSVGIVHLDWSTMMDISGTAALASILTSIATLKPIVDTLDVPVSGPATAAPVALVVAREPVPAPVVPAATPEPAQPVTAPPADPSAPHGTVL